MSTDDGESRPLRVGVVGLGWAGRQHLNSYLNLPGVEVKALAGMEPELLARLAEEHGVEHTYDRWEDLVANEELDALSVATPPYLHAPVTVAALEAGMHVLSEKPVARTGDEAQRMVDTAKKMNRVFQVAFNFRHRSDARILKRHIDQGHLGHVYYSKARWLRRSGVPAGTGWFTTKELAGGGPLLDLGVHMLDLSLWLLGEPKVVSVTASTYAELGPRRQAVPPLPAARPPVFDVEDIAAAFMRLAGGETLTLEASWASYSGLNDRFGVTLFGNEGGAEIDVPNYGEADTLRIYTDVADAPAEIRPLLGRSEGHQGVVRDFVAAIRSEQWERYRGEDALARARIIDACYLSASEGHEVAVVADF